MPSGGQRPQKTKQRRNEGAFCTQRPANRSHTLSTHRQDSKEQKVSVPVHSSQPVDLLVRDCGRTVRSRCPYPQLLNRDHLVCLVLRGVFADGRGGTMLKRL